MAAVGRRHLDRSRGKRPGSIFCALDDLPELGIRIVRVRQVGLVGQQQLGHHAARGLGAVGLGLDLHAGRRRADAARGQHALALDLDHADAAIAVRPVAGLGRVAQMRQLDVVAAAGAEDRLARADVDLLAVDEEGVGLACVGAHVHPSRLSPRKAGAHTTARRIAKLVPAFAGTTAESLPLRHHHHVPRLGQFIGEILQHA